MISVLIVDDHKLIRLALRKLLAQAGDIEIIGEATNGEEAIHLAGELKPHIVLMDIQMPGMNGLEATQVLLRKYPHIKVIALTAHNADPFPFSFIKAGATGYLTKNVDADELTHAIHSVARGHRYITPEIAQQLALRQVAVEALSPFAAVSKRELQVMLMITNGHGIPVIAKKLHISSKTVNTYRYRLFEKLHVKNDVELTHLTLRYKLLDSVHHSK